MTAAFPADTPTLRDLRRLRLAQAVTLAAVAAASVVGGVAALALWRPGGGLGAFVGAVALEFVIWGAIDAVFAGVGLGQSARTARTPVTPQAEADEIVDGEKLLRALRFNHRLNVGYLVTAAALLAWAAYAASGSLAGHGAGVGVQGGFLFVFDAVYAARLCRVVGDERAC